MCFVLAVNTVPGRLIHPAGNGEFELPLERPHGYLRPTVKIAVPRQRRDGGVFPRNDVQVSLHAQHGLALAAPAQHEAG